MEGVQYLTIFNKQNGEWPKKVALKLFNSVEQSDIYTVQPTCHMNTRTIEDSVYNCKCSNCGESGDPWDKYCRHCGAKSLGVKQCE